MLRRTISNAWRRLLNGWHLRGGAIRGSYRRTITLEQLEQRRAPAVNVLTYHNDIASTGTNTGETVLTPTNVNVNSFGKLASLVLDGQVYAQPLVQTSVVIASGVNTTAGISGTYNVIFVATQHDTLYAVNTAAGANTVLWKRSFTNINANYVGSVLGSNINNPLGATTVSTLTSGDVNSTDITPEIGITGTPVIDPNTNTIYVSVKTKEVVGGATYFVQRLHAINIADGTDRLTPYQLGTTTNGNTNNTAIWMYGTGDGAVADSYFGTNKQVVQFNALREAEREAVNFENGQIYVAFASHGDSGPYHGWVVSFAPGASSFSLTGVLNTSPNNGLAGIWGGGGRLTFEADGSYFYFETGNGSGGAPTLNAAGFPNNANYNEAVLKATKDLTTSVNNQGPNGWGLKIVDYFIPYNVNALDQADADFGSGSPLILPPSAGIPGHPNLLVAAGKSGQIYLIDRDNMGHFDSTRDHVVNAIANGTGAGISTAPNLINGSLSTPAFFNGSLYWTSGYSGPAYSYAIAGSGTMSATSQTTATFGYLPGSAAVSANGTLNGIVWIMDRNANLIRAYNAGSFSNELWNSGQHTGGTDSLAGSVIKFATPTIANGQVFVGTSDSLDIFGLNQQATAPSNPPVLAATALSGSSVNLNWTDNTTAPNTATSYVIEESSDNVNFSVVTSTPAGSTAIAIGGLFPNTTYWFRIRGLNAQAYSNYSNTAHATTTNAITGLNFSNGFSGATGLTLNGNAAYSGSNLVLTNGGTNQASSVFSSTALDITSFATQFTFQSSSGASSAEGFTFTFQGVGNTALGASGAALGYGPATGGGNSGISQSVAVKFDLNNNAGEGQDSTGLYVNGAAPTDANSLDMTASGIDLHSGDVFQVNMTYDGTTLAVTIKDTAHPLLTFTHSFAVSIASDVGNSTGYVGFTASTGTATATQSILTWTYAPTAPQSPNAPSGLGAVAASANSVSLFWTNNSTNQTSFNLDRATDTAFTQNLITQNLTPANLAAYVDTAPGITPGGTYYYRLRAFNSAGNSGNSNVAIASIPLAPPKPTVPQPPLVSQSQSSIVVDIESTSITLQWQDNAGEADVYTGLEYDILRSVNQGAFSLVATLPPSSHAPPTVYEWTDINLTPNTYYEYHVEAVDVSGHNDFVGAHATTLTSPPNLVYSQLNNNAVTLYYTIPPGAVGMNIYRGTASGQETLLASTGVSSGSYVDATVQNGTTYYYYVTAVNQTLDNLNEESDPSNESSPASGGGAFQWTGAGGNSNWTTAANWTGGVAPKGTGNETLIFPSGAAKLTNVDDFPAGGNAFAGILTSGAGYNITINNPLALGSGGLSLSVAGTEAISSAGSSVAIFLLTNESFSAVSGATLTINSNITELNGALLTVSGNGNTTLGGSIVGAGGLTVTETGILTLGGANTYSGPTTISAGTVMAGTSTSLGMNSDVSVASGAALNVLGILTPGVGLVGQYYNVAPQSANFVSLTAIQNSLAGRTPALTALSSTSSLNNSFDFDNNGDAFPAPYNANAQNFEVVYTGDFIAPTSGSYTFDTASDDGSMLFIDGNVVVNNNNFQGVTTQSGTLSLSAGPHSIVIAFYQGGGGYGLYADVKVPGGTLQRIPNSLLGQISTNNLQVGSLAGDGTVALGTNQITVGGSNHAAVFTGIVSGTSAIGASAAGVTKTGTASQVIGQPNYSGATTISAGTLQFGDGIFAFAAIPAGAISDNGTLVIANPTGSTLTYGNTISGTGGVTVFGGGSLTLSGSNSYTGPTLISGGTVIAGNNSSLGINSDVTVGAGATLNLPATSSTGLAGTYYSSAPNNPDSAQFNTLSALTNYVAGLPVIATDRSSAPNGQNSNGTVFDYGTAGAGFPSAVLANPNQFIGVWSGVLTTSTSGSYTFDTASDDGSMLFIDGNVVVSNNNYQGVTAKSGTLSLSAGPHSIVIAYYQGNGGYGFYADVQLPGGSLQRIPASLLNNPTNLQVGSLGGAGNVVVAGNNSLTAGGNNNSSTLTGALSGTGSVSKAGAGTMLLSQPQYSGATTVTGGILQFGDGVTSVASLPTSSIVDNGTVVFDNPSGVSLTYAGSITGSGGITATGSGALTLSGNNPYQGATHVAGGVVNAVSTTTTFAVGSLSALTVDSGAVLNLLGQAPTGQAGLAGKYYSSPNAPDNAQFNSLAALNAYVAGLPVIATDRTNTANGQNNSGAVFDYGSNGAGFPAAILANPNNFIAIWTGQFNAQTNGSYLFDTGSDDGSMIYIDGNVVVNNNAYQGVTVKSGSVGLSPGLHSIAIAYYQGGGGYGMYADVQTPGGALQRIPNSSLGTGTAFGFGSLAGGGNFAISLTNATIAVGSNNLSTTFGGVLSGSIAINKVGTGALTLAGVDTYAGPTTVAAGSLIVNGSLASSVSLGASTTLGGVGTVGAVSSVSGAIATINPGAASTDGRLTVGNLALGAGTLFLNLDGISSYDSVKVTGSTINLSSTNLSLAITPAGIHAGDQYTIVSNPNNDAYTGSFVGAAEGATITVGSMAFKITYQGGTSHHDVVLTSQSNGPFLVSGFPALNTLPASANDPTYAKFAYIQHPGQHSMVESVVYSFGNSVSLSRSDFTITNKGPASIGGFNFPAFVPDLNVTGSNNNTRWTVTFANHVVGGVEQPDGVSDTTGSVGDGKYEIVLNSAASSLTSTFDFYRLLGDVNHKGIVDGDNFQALITSLNQDPSSALYVGAFDFDGGYLNPTVNGADFQTLVTNFNHSVLPIDGFN